MVVTTIVVTTAIPYAADNASEVLNDNIKIITNTNKDQFTKEYKSDLVPFQRYRQYEVLDNIPFELLL